MEQFANAFEQRKGLLLVLFILFLFGLILFISGVRYLKNTRWKGIFMVISGVAVILGMLFLMFFVFTFGMNW